jgi:gliding motility-associated-like protein
VLNNKYSLILINQNSLILKNSIFGILLFLLVLFAPLKQIQAQTALSPGDIAILLVQTRGTDNFAFVTFVDIDPGTVIYFTDCGADAAGFNTPCTEGAFAYTVPAGGLTAGDIIQYTDNPALFVPYTDGRITGTSFLLSTIGDQVVAFQDASNPGGSINAANNPQFIFVNNVESTIFAGNKADTNETGLPAGLTDVGASRNALGLGAGPGPGDEFDTAIYNSTYDFSSGGIPAARLAFSDLSNYYQTNLEDATYNTALANIPPALTLAASCAATDNTPPVPDVDPLPNVTAQCEVTSLTPPTATDNCGGPVTVTNNATLPITTQGTTVVTWTYDDGNGNTSTQNQNIVIDDTTPPVPDVATLPDVTAQCEVTSLTPPTATDNCGGTVTVTNNATLPITTQGTTVITWTYDDGNGNTDTQTQNVVINDTTPPTPDAASLPDITAECEVTSLTPPTATDNCGGAVIVTNNATLPITTTTTVTWAFDDGNGNTDTQTQNVVINDNTAPVPDAASLPDITAECEVTSLTPPTATDNCGGIVTVTNNVTLPITAQGTTVITWTFDDGNGNTATQNQNVIIDDITPPVPDVATLPNVTAQCEVTSLTPPTATDNCGGTVIVTSNATLPINTQGTTVITWTYDDGNGNTDTQTQNVVINDTTPPTPDVASLPDVTAQCEVTSLTPPTATDNCGGTVIVTNNATLPITTQGTTVITWTYDDGNGNITFQNQTIVIDDITPPTPDAASLPDVTAECEVTSLTPPTATDNCGGAVIVTNNATLPITTTTTVTWAYDDGNGNITFQNQNVVINDNTAPVPDAASLPDITAQCEVTSLTPPTATDNCGGTVIVTNNVTLPITAQGTTVITWTFDDGNGNTATQTQNVIIDDITPPVPDVATLPNVTAQCEVTSLTPPTATDNCGGTIIVTNNATLPITTQGSTTITWAYDDGNGNITFQNQTIVIDDTISPTPDVATLPNVTAQCEVTSLTPPTATDNCGGTVIVTNNATLPITTQGTTVITWTYDDGNGNITFQNQTIVVDDITPPTPDVASLPDVTAECEVNSLIVPSATDNCGGTIIVTNNASLPVTSSTTITWAYDDGNGNITFQNQNIIIDDTTAPVPDAASLPDITAQCEVTSLTPPTATDNCGGTVIVTNNVTLPITAQGTTVITWTFDDGNGNTATQTQNVIIDDITPPVPDVATLPNVTAQCEVTSLTPPTATDNCGGTIIVTNNATLPITTQGSTTITWAYDDGNGNITFQNQTIVIDDTTPPTPDVASLPDVTAQCEVTSLTPPTATDNCGGTVIVTNNATLPITTQGTTVITWTYDDGNGNTGTQTQNVVINDVTAPVPDAATLPDVISECEVTSLVVPTATDNCGGTVTVTSDAAFPINTQGTTVVTWTFDDGNGNTSTQDQNVVINDVTSPVPDAASLPDITAECEVTDLTSPTATDNCAGTVIVTNDITLPINTQGTTVVTWTFDDGNGNTTTQSQNVIINDVTNPVAVCNNLEVTLDLSGSATITAAEVDGGSTDNCGIASVTIDNDTFTCANVGENTVILTVTDINGNTNTCEATVTVSSDGMAVASNDGPVCAGDDIQLSETSGIATSWSWTTDGAATFDDATSQNPIVSNAGNGETFTVEITFSGGCTAVATTTVTVFEIAVPQGDSNQEFCQDASATLLEIEVDADETVLWYATASGDTPLSDDTLLVDGSTYYASQFDEGTGCESLERLAVTVSFINCADISSFKKRAFSPNGDGINDTFTITELRSNYPNYTMEVYNRNGSLLYKGNASSPDWDGTSSEGSALGDGIVPNGVYFFIINFGDGETKPFQGIIYLNR